MPALRSCLAQVDGRLCGELFTPTRQGQSRCAVHDQAQKYAQLQRKRAIRPYDHGERLRREAAVAKHRARYGDWCPGWEAGGRPAHAVTARSGPLSADHTQSVARGGAEGGVLTVRCIACNAAKGTHSA